MPNVLGPRQFLVGPQGLWHRFETPDGVKVMSVTPQPSEHHHGYDIVWWIALGMFEAR